MHCFSGRLNCQSFSFLWQAMHGIAMWAPSILKLVLLWRSRVYDDPTNPLVVWQSLQSDKTDFLVNCPLWKSVWQSAHRLCSNGAVKLPLWHFLQSTVTCLSSSLKFVLLWSNFSPPLSILKDSSLWHSTQFWPNLFSCLSLWQLTHPFPNSIPLNFW